MRNIFDRSTIEIYGFFNMRNKILLSLILSLFSLSFFGVPVKAKELSLEEVIAELPFVDEFNVLMAIKRHEREAEAQRQYEQETVYEFMDRNVEIFGTEDERPTFTFEEAIRQESNRVRRIRDVFDAREDRVDSMRDDLDNMRAYARDILDTYRL